MTNRRLWTEALDNPHLLASVPTRIRNAWDQGKPDAETGERTPDGAGIDPGANAGAHPDGIGARASLLLSVFRQAKPIVLSENQRAAARVMVIRLAPPSVMLVPSHSLDVVP